MLKLGNFVASIIPIEGLKDGYEALKDFAFTIHEKYKSQDVLHVADDYLNGFYGKTGSISECDAFTYLIQKSLEQMMAKSVLIIEDLDRIDPAHLFRIMNVLSSQVDNPYYSAVPHGNKFGFDKIILVMDYEIARHLFHHFYGKEANYEGYMNKFLNTLPYSYSIKEEAHRQVEAKLLDTCKTKEVLSVVQQLSSNKEDSFSVPLAIMQMSVRRCKEFLDMDVCSLIRNTWIKGEYDIPTQTVWTKILACYRFLFPDRSLDAIQEMMLYGFSDLQLAELYAPYNYALKGVNEFYMECENGMYDFCYIKGKNLVRRGRVLSWQSDKILDLAEIRKELQKLNHDIRNLLLG